MHAPIHCTALIAAIVAASAFVATPAVAAPNDFSARQRIPATSNAAVQTLLDWQRELFDLPESRVYERFGEPDRRRPMQTPAGHQLIYHLTRRSNLEISITDGRVSAVAVLVMPSADEAGPIDD